jgi:dinuclear metal center YbgI/SA1388 family protein
MKLSKITSFFNEKAPNRLQEKYDNSGLLLGDPNIDISKALISLDVTDEIIDEAIAKNCDLIISHHPLIFKPIKKLISQNLTERLVVRAIKNDIALFAIHTNLDNVSDGVNNILAKKLGIINHKILSPSASKLNKIVCFCPSLHIDKVKEAMFNAGAGHIENYDNCSFSSKGVGSFRALEGAQPFVGEKHKIHHEEEIRIETIVPDFKTADVIRNMTEAHPYEEVAYDIYQLENKSNITGAGMIGELIEEMDISEFLHFVKKQLNTKYIKHNKLLERKIKKVAICGGSGSFLINEAHHQKADIYITGDIKYHEYFEHQGEMTIVDAGHYETEQFTKELIHSFLNEKFPNFAVQISETITNPVVFL